MLKSISLGLFLSLAWASLTFACTCLDRGKFKKYSKEQTVVRATVINYGPKLSHGKTLYATMKVTVSEVIKGSYEFDSINFTGDPGHLCLTYIDSDIYSLGSEHLFIASSVGVDQGLAGCGEVSVSIADGKIHGAWWHREKWSEYSMDYDKFIRKITK